MAYTVAAATRDDEMQDWTLECLRRAIIAGVFAAIAIASQAYWLKITAIVCFVVFFAFLVRNPDGWARRLAYSCTMLGVGLVFQLGTAVSATGWFETGGMLEDVAWIGAVFVRIEQGSAWPGLALLGCGLGFGGLELIGRRLKASESAVAGAIVSKSATHWMKAQPDGLGFLSVNGIVPVLNDQGTPRYVGHATLRRHRLLDRILIQELVLVRVLRLVRAGPELPPDYVEVSPDAPFEVAASQWTQFEVQFRFRDRIRSVALLRVLGWVFGLNRRYVDLQLGGTRDEVHTSEAVLVRI
jgi:hypothetical protein